LTAENVFLPQYVEYFRHFDIKLFNPQDQGGRIMNVPTISPVELQEEIQNGRGVELLDVRTPVEFREVHATPARNVPLDRLQPEQFLASRSGRRDKPIYVICRTGNRARQAAVKLLAAGVESVVNVEGGTQAWEQRGLPVIRGKKVISLERQVRIGAGSLVLVGAVLSWQVNPAWIGLSAFVGGGLIFSGVTDYCGMAMLLARMPWNRCPIDEQCAV
jgi:rhodanese-related sulfurtransferase